MNAHYLAWLGKVAGEMMTAIIRAGHKNESRSGTARAIINHLQSTDLDEAARRFVGNRIMSMYGYGGGL